MSRYHRLDPVDSWHHVTNHAVGNEDLFLIDRDRREFLRRMYEGADKFGVTVAAFCLMGNHVHLVLHCPDGGISKFMHYVESIYAREFNMRHGRRDALFGKEFYNKLITTEGQLLATIRYVHRNPLELGINIRSYPWSSYLAYVAEDHTFFRPDLSVAVHLLGGAAEHRIYVETDFAHDNSKLAEGVRVMPVAAPESTARAVQQLCQIAAERCAVSIQEIVAPRATARSDARKAVTLIAYESRVGFAEELRSVLGYRTGSALRSAVQRGRRLAATDAVFAELIAHLRRSWVLTDESIAS